MTPKEMRAMTTRMNSAHVPAYALREDLKVALTALSELQDAYNEVIAALRERAERAEAKVAQWREVAELHNDEFENANAALARVLRLADEMDAAQRPGHKSPTAARIRAAIEGDNQ